MLSVTLIKFTSVSSFEGQHDLHFTSWSSGLAIISWTVYDFDWSHAASWSLDSILHRLAILRYFLYFGCFFVLLSRSDSGELRCPSTALVFIVNTHNSGHWDISNQCGQLTCLLFVINTFIYCRIMYRLCPMTYLFDNLYIRLNDSLKDFKDISTM